MCHYKKVVHVGLHACRSGHEPRARSGIPTSQAISELDREQPTGGQQGLWRQLETAPWRSLEGHGFELIGA